MTSLHQWMLRYQEARGEPPTLQEIAEAFPNLNWRSSARWAVKLLESQGLVVTHKGPDMARRYMAVGREVRQDDTQ